MCRQAIHHTSSIIRAFTTCVGHIVGHPEWPVVLTEPGRVRLSHSTALDAGFGTEHEPTHITIGFEEFAITRLAIIADDICALDITPHATATPALPTPDVIIARPDNLLAVLRPSPPVDYEIAYLDLIGYRNKFVYLKPPHEALAGTTRIGQPILLSTPAPISITHLVGFIDEINPDYICSSRFTPTR